ncbi:hypothetical protein [Tepidibacter mesophilus]|uniref:hypothetical protein n=1 Tax=Tepidibacter mesophilus TaxID=655607 RepID=UPI000C07EFA6|nr:hypothetical protein [Tepidibacter mesophilus]
MYTNDQLQIIINSLDFSIDRLENHLKYSSNYLSIEEKKDIQSDIEDYKEIQIKTEWVLGNNEIEKVLGDMFKG